jgi:hypothetical protein
MSFSTTIVVFCSWKEYITVSAAYSCVKSSGSNLKTSHRRHICDCRYTKNILSTINVQYVYDRYSNHTSRGLLFTPVKAKAKGNFRTAAILFHIAQKNCLSKCSLFQMYDNNHLIIWK